jgi:hypothetical protein
VLFALERGARYRGVVSLSSFQKALAPPRVIKAKLTAAGVRVLILRPIPTGYEISGIYNGPSGTVELPPQVTSLERHPIENVDHLESPKVRGGNPRPRKSVRVRRPRGKILG